MGQTPFKAQISQNIRRKVGHIVFYKDTVHTEPTAYLLLQELTNADSCTVENGKDFYPLSEPVNDDENERLATRERLDMRST